METRVEINMSVSWAVEVEATVNSVAMTRRTVPDVALNADPRSGQYGVVLIDLKHQEKRT